MKNSILTKPGQDKDFINRLIILIALFFILIFILFLMVSYIQILKNPEFARKTKNTREKTVRIPPIRGKILSSDEVVLADNKKIYSLYINDYELSKNIFERQKSLLYISNVLSYNYSDIEKIISSKMIRARDDILIADNIDFLKFIKIYENIENMPGVIIKERYIRNYPNKNTLSHVLGYVGPIDSSEYAIKKQIGYEQNDIIGKNGIEKQYEDDLRGKDGKKVYIVDARMVIQNELKNKEVLPQAGSEIVLTVNLELQKNIEDILADRIGTILVMKPHNGEILAMTSYPSFDPNIYVLENEENTDKKRLIDLDTKDTPLLNRNIQSLYPAASIFKIITSTAIINENIISFDKQYYCGGSYRLNNQTFGCWIRNSSTGGHGFVNLREAMAQSCDIYYYNAGLVVGIERISKYAIEYGLGSSLGVDLPFEKGGLIPSIKWKKEQNMSWHLGDTLNTVIGQGDVKITPLQLANVLAVVCNRGVAYKPHFLKELKSSTDGSIVKTFEKEKIIDTGLPKYVYDIVEDHLRTVITTGTGKWAFWGNDYKIVGKTGTAEYGFGVKKNTHSLFAGYGPINFPKEEQIVVMILIENDNNEYLKYAARLANLVFNSWLRKENFKESAKRFGFPILDSYQ